MLVRKLADAPVKDWHQVTSRILMDAGELGSRQMTITSVELAPGVTQEFHSHEDAEQAFVVMRGVLTLTVAGDSEQLGHGDLALIPPASDYTLANEAGEELALLSVQSPPVSVDETLGRQHDAYDYDEDEM